MLRDLIWSLWLVIWSVQKVWALRHFYKLIVDSHSIDRQTCNSSFCPRIFRKKDEAYSMSRWKSDQAMDDNKVCFSMLKIISFIIVSIKYNTSSQHNDTTKNMAASKRLPYNFNTVQSYQKSSKCPFCIFMQDFLYFISRTLWVSSIILHGTLRAHLSSNFSCCLSAIKSFADALCQKIVS